MKEITTFKKENALIIKLCRGQLINLHHGQNVGQKLNKGVNNITMTNINNKIIIKLPNNLPLWRT